MLRYRQNMDKALGMAKTDAERGELKLYAERAGIDPNSYVKRENWWQSRR
jgi:hypothetical protein